jgi:hypothetical protein
MSTDTCTHDACATDVDVSRAANEATKLKATIVVLSDPKSGS